MLTIELQKKVQPHVSFETRPVEDRNATEREGRRIYNDVDFVLIRPPGGKDEVIHIAQEWLKNKRRDALAGRFDLEWVELYEKAYSRWKQGQEMPVSGTPLKMCPSFSPAEVENCVSLNIRTLEELATLSEEGIGRLGMGGRLLKERAINLLKAAENGGKAAMQIEALQVENAELRARLEALEEAASKPRRGRPPKDEE